MNDTIFALASGAGRAGMAVMRLSGPAAAAALTALAGRAPPPPRRATRVRLCDGAGEVIDAGLALWFPAPRSFTGEDVAELHVHGGPAVLAGLGEALLGLGLRPAEPGEFSRRAFDNGKMDLTAAEGLADLVAAETAAQRRQALRQMDGALHRRYEDWRARLLRAQAWLEAGIDFSDEADVAADVVARARAEVAALAEAVAALLAAAPRGERLREGLEVAILGAPNVGKSTLLNRLAGREAAIVAATAGTTRDVIEVRLDMGGWPVVLADTAGLQAAADAVEDEGVRRALARAEAADLRLLVFDATALPGWDAGTAALARDGDLVVVNKSDAAAGVPERWRGRAVRAVSAATGEGIAALEAALEGAAAAWFADGGAALPTRARHRHALAECAAALRRAAAAAAPELAGEDVRLAARALGRITGRVDVEDVLDAVFGAFCIGK